MQGFGFCDMKYSKHSARRRHLILLRTLELGDLLSFKVSFMVKKKKKKLITLKLCFVYLCEDDRRSLTQE